MPVVNAGDVYAGYEVTINRTYYNERSETVTLDTIGASDIPLVIMVLEKAKQWIEEQSTS